MKERTIQLSCRRVCGVLMAMCIAIASVAFAAPATLPAAQPATRPATQPATVPAAQPVWHHAMKDAYAQALKQDRPILLVVGAEWCGPCKVLEKEMEKPKAAAALARWVRVHVDSDQSPEAAGWLQTGSIPVIRLLSPTGRRIDVKEGAMSEEDLARWVDAKYEQAVAAASAELMESGEPDAATLRKLLDRLGETDPTLREAAVSRLMPYPTLAAGGTVESFAKGNLAVRLACLELLRQWKAPVDGLDPWQPETITNQTIKSLLDWVATARPAAPLAATRPSDLSPEQLQAARQEIARMVSAASDENARSARERLSRVGRGLLPDVLQQLKQATTDQARERLLALRYRLSASDALVLAWRGGIERLAATDVQVRHNAAEELVSRASPADSALLLELFSDSDPLVREISLRGLRAVGKGDAAKAMIGLLFDPDPNVRAAVLKQLAENPAPGLVATIVEFTTREQDPDLIVHAVRVLKQSKSDKAVSALLALLQHQSWRVRAESAEALTEMAGRSSNASAGRQADVYAAMVKLLDDADGFVVSRAVIALQNADLVIAIQPMVRAAERNPELTGDVIRALTSGSRCKEQAVVHLRKFCQSPNEQARSQAISHLVTLTGEVEQEMKTLLKDKEVGVRMWAAASLFQLINSWRPDGSGDRFGNRRVRSEEQAPQSVWQWCCAFRLGTNRPKWMMDVIPDLEELTKQPNPQARIDGALPLLALAPQEKSIEIIRGAVQAEGGQAARASGALPWIASEERIALFKLLIRLGQGSKGMSDIMESMGVIAHPEAPAAIWELLDSPKADIELASVVLQGLGQVHSGRRYFDAERLDAKSRKELITQAQKKMENPSELVRIAAMALLLSISPGDAAAATQKVTDDPAAPAALKLDAYQVRLLALNGVQGNKLALEMLKSSDPAKRVIALKYFCTGGDDIHYLRDEIYLSHSNPDLRSNYVSRSEPWVPAVPQGLTADMLRPLLAVPDGEEAWRAGYLLALLGEREGLDVVIRHWRGAKEKHRVDQQMVYRGIAALGDDTLVPVLEEIYRGYEKDSYEVRQFYWTIRIMKGEKALLLRKRIRDEVGMEQLR